ncbi:hypothetical protein TNCV_388981 [Trichonephila clavipes]|nr:hypothetical protein TNCV_388981 [Trichonephila clavipes]
MVWNDTDACSESAVSVWMTSKETVGVMRSCRMTCLSSRLLVCQERPESGRHLSENESEGGDLSCSNLDSDEDKGMRESAYE